MTYQEKLDAIQLAEKQLALLKADLWKEPFKQWEPQHGRWVIDLSGNVSNRDSSENMWAFGLSYKTKEQAEWARDQMRRFHRLLAYVAEFDVDENGVQWMPDWSNIFQSKHFVYYSNDDIVWYTDRWSKRQDITVLMSEQCAEDLVIRLNEGSVVL